MRPLLWRPLLWRPGGIGKKATWLGKATAWSLRQGIEITADTVVDVGVYGHNLESSLAWNTVGSIGGEALFKGIAAGVKKGWRTGRNLVVSPLAQESVEVTQGVASSFDEFRVGRNFASEMETQKAWEVYQRAGQAEKGIVIGHGHAPIDNACDGWQAFRMLYDSPAARRMNSVTWTEEINMAWIDGAVDAGKPVRLITPFDDVYRGTVMWREIQRAISRGGRVIAK